MLTLHIASQLLKAAGWREGKRDETERIKQQTITSEYNQAGPDPSKRVVWMAVKACFDQLQDRTWVWSSAWRAWLVNVAFLCLFTCLISQPFAMLFLACLTHSSFCMRGKTMSLVRVEKPVSEYTLYILTYSQNKDAACEAFTTCSMSVQFSELQAQTQVFATGQTQP